MNADAIRRAMIVVLFVGAATSDASPEQRERLKAEALPPLYDKALKPGNAYKACVLATAAVMGPDWRPRGEWDEWIVALLDGAGS